VLEGSNVIIQTKILSSVISSQIKTHAKTGGVVPEVAARMHIEKIIPVIKKTLSDAKKTLKDLDAIAVTAGPGLITSLMVGVDTAKALGMALGIPVLAINHMEAHVFSAFVSYSSSESALAEKSRSGSKTKFSTSSNNNPFPTLSLVVSGGHTELVFVKNWLNYKKIGSTQDDAAGEAFDKIAKLLGLHYPGGPALSKLALQGKTVIDFPRPMINVNNFNFSFSGLKTAVLYHLKDVIAIRQERRSNPLGISGLFRRSDLRNDKVFANIAASAQQAIIDVLVCKTVAAAKKYKVKTITIGGGVAANQKLREEMSRAIKKNFCNSKLLIPDSSLCTDNAVMIAYAGYLHIKKKKIPSIIRLKADANWEL